MTYFTTIHLYNINIIVYIIHLFTFQMPIYIIINLKIILYSYIYIMDRFTQLFWFFSLLFIVLSVYLLCCTKKTNIFYLQIISGCGMFATSKIGRNFLGLE
jgi:hypothetical protein